LFTKTNDEFLFLSILITRDSLFILLFVKSFLFDSRKIDDSIGGP
jgi:hypothetical protein